MIIHDYEKANGKGEIVEYIKTLPVRERTDGFSVLENLEKDNFDLLHIKPWRGKIKEVYFYKHNRVFYILANKKHIYLIHACKKEKNKTAKKDVKLLLKRAKELEQYLKNN